MVAVAGNYTEKSNFDCKINLEISNSGGIDTVYTFRENNQRDEIVRLANEIFKFFDVLNAKLTIEDFNALPFVFMARLETAIKQLLNTDKSFLPEFKEENRYELRKDCMRISRMYFPANNPKLMLHPSVKETGGVIFDLEDSVSLEKKQEARILLRNALRQVDIGEGERLVRINAFPEGLDDLEFIVPNHIHGIVLPKCSSAAQVKQVDVEIEHLRQKYQLSQPVYIIPQIESALGIENAFDIATSSKNVVALTLGLEDYTADIDAQRTVDGKESLYARTRLVNACKAAKIQAIDSIFTDVANMTDLRKVAEESAAMGFDGMGCIHPKQIAVIHEAFAPSAQQIEEAKEIMEAFKIAMAQGQGVVTVNNKMIDAPVVKRAQKIIDKAHALGISV